jgi:hypothetical protein
VVDAFNHPLATAPVRAEAVQLLRDVAAFQGPLEVGHHTPMGIVAGTSQTPLIIPPGSAASLQPAFAPAEQAEPTPGDVRITLALVPEPAGAPPVLLLEVLAEPWELDDHAERAATPRLQALRRRTVVIDWPLDAAPGAFGLYIPGAGGGSVNSLWVIADQGPDDSAQAAEESARLLARIASEAAPSTPTPGALLAASLQGQMPPSRLRRTLVLISSDTGAETCGEAALLLDDDLLAMLADELSAALSQAPGDARLAQLGWLCDRSGLILLARLQSQNLLSPGAMAMLSARFGEVGRNPSLLSDLAVASATREDFVTRLLAEHVLLLDDISPSARVRALEWMTAHGQVVEGYDPAAAVQERRAAIDVYLQSRAAPQP